jgi:glucose/arabinose dehydrogenase
VATGDAGVPELAQDPNSRNGKFLRIPGSDLRDGGRARPQIVSLGHRNPQGIDFQPGSGRLVATEHGQEACDEVNVIRQGNNYGWPEKDCRGQREAGFTPPKVLYESPGIAPSGSTFVRQRSRWRGDYLVAGLKGQQISQVVLKGNTLKVQRVRALFRGDFGRIRTVVQGPDALYALTSNGTDDRILRITPPSRG